jgi:hypothetical protein
MLELVIPFLNHRTSRKNAVKATLTEPGRPVPPAQSEQDEIAKVPLKWREYWSLSAASSVASRGRGRQQHDAACLMRSGTNTGDCNAVLIGRRLRQRRRQPHSWMHVGGQLIK